MNPGLILWILAAVQKINELRDSDDIKLLKEELARLAESARPVLPKLPEGLTWAQYEAQLRAELNATLSDIENRHR